MENVLKIWCNNLYAPLEGKDLEWFRQSLSEHHLELFNSKENGKDGESAKALAEADIAFGSPDADAVIRAQNLAWVHISTAGYTAYDREDFKQEMERRGTIVTNSSTVYDEPCAQHLLAMMMSLARQLPYTLDEQRENQSWKTQEFRRRMRLLNEQTVLIFGFGTIAERLVELLTPLKIKLIGVRRKVQGDEPIQIITEEQVDKYLPAADHIINILPDNSGTKNYFSAERLSKIKEEAIYYNIGRGTTVDQNALVELLEQKKIAAAYLDVTDPEPLPPDHPLWTVPNCFITPHVAGGSTDEKERQVKHFLSNLKRFQNGEELVDRIF